MIIRKLKYLVGKEGFFLCGIFFLNYLINKIYSFLLFCRLDINVCINSRIEGKRYIRLGKNFNSGKNLWLAAVERYRDTLISNHIVPHIYIGNNVSVGEYVHIGCNHRIVIGDDVLMGSKIYITDHNHGVYRGDNADSPAIPPADRRLTEGESVEIGARCWIGEFVTILPGVTIGEGCIIGSHSTVTHDIPANSIAVGSPARVVKVWDETLGQWVKV